MTSADRYRDLAPLAALGALDGTERTDFEVHVESCPDCRRDLEAYRALTHRLPLALPESRPSPALRQRVLDAIAAEGTRPSPAAALSFPRTAWLTLLAGLPAAAALVLGVALLAARNERDEARRTALAAHRSIETLEAEARKAREGIAQAHPQAGDAARPDPASLLHAAREAQSRLAALEQRLREELEKARQALAARELEATQAREAMSQSEQRFKAEAEAARQAANVLEAQVRTVQADLADTRQHLEREKSFRELVAHPDSRVTPLTGVAAGSRARARVVWNPTSKEAVLLVSGLPKAPEGKGYEVWVMGKEAPVAAGVFQVDAEGRALFRFPTLDETARVKTFAVTIEPAAGRPAPSGPIVLAGAVS